MSFRFITRALLKQHVKQRFRHSMYTLLPGLVLLGCILLDDKGAFLVLFKFTLHQDFQFQRQRVSDWWIFIIVLYIKPRVL